MEIITIGGATQDVIIYYKNAQTVEFHNSQEHTSFILLQEGAKIEVEDTLISTGGGATNAAVSFKRLGFQAAPLCNIGTDHEGDSIITALQKERVITSLIHRDSQHKTGISYIIPSLQADRTILAYRGANGFLTESMIDTSLITQAKVLYITSLSGKAAPLLKSLAHHAHQNNLLVANNPGISQLSAGAHLLCESLPFIDILILNSSEAQQLMISLVSEHQIKPIEKRAVKAQPKLLQNLVTIRTMHFNIIQCVKEFMKYGPSIIAITNGAEGVYVAQGNTLYFHPSLPTHIKSTLGAGDAFGSAFVASLYQKNPIERALLHGLLNSKSVIEHADAKKGLLTAQQMQQQEQQISLDLLQHFEF